VQSPVNGSYSQKIVYKAAKDSEISIQKVKKIIEPPKRHAHCVRRQKVRCARCARIVFLRSFWRRRKAPVAFWRFKSFFTLQTAFQ
jgi:hypothetical protein